jgi:hypothetical protein
MYEAIPGAVVVDTIDGYTFARGADGELFTPETATAFAKHRNASSKLPTYCVFMLAAPAAPGGEPAAVRQFLQELATGINAGHGNDWNGGDVVDILLGEMIRRGVDVNAGLPEEPE